MSQILFLCILFLKIPLSLQAPSRCDFSECNHEGQCRKDNNKMSCICIGTEYFMGPNCSQAIDNCQHKNPCQNGGRCKNVVGQFICEDCNAGFGGLWCDLEVSNVFTKMLLYFNHYAFYGEAHNFLIMVETLGDKSFSLEFVGDNYAITGHETEPEQASEWTYSRNLAKVINNFGIRYQQDLPYAKGYYHLASETFWSIGLLNLILRAYDSETATHLFYQNEFKLLLLARQVECLPSLSFIHGTNPLEPLMLDMASYNNFEVVLKKRCFQDSELVLQWSVYNSVGTAKLHNFGSCKDFILKTRPYKFWFKYHGEIKSSYRIVVRLLEYTKHHVKETQARCYILILPKPVTALIKGGRYREIGIKQNLIMDASKSRDFALAPNNWQDMFFTWDCISVEDANNEYCKTNMGASSILKIDAQKLKIHNTYNFTLSINSKVNTYVSDQTYQVVKITENFQLDIDIKCVRNCLRNKFIQEDLLHLKAVSRGKEFTQAATFKWTLEEEVIGEKDHVVYFTKKGDQVLNIQVVVQDETLTGKAIETFEVNLPPVNGSCTIEPLLGEAFLTDFHIKCHNYKDADRPLSYEYLEENGFPLQRTNERELHTRLPPTNGVIIKICDQFEACIENSLKVPVKELTEVDDLKEVWQKKHGGLKYLLETGDILTAMILLKSLTKSLKTIEAAAAVIKEMDRLTITTLLQVEQFLEINKNLVGNYLPLAAEKAYVLNKYLSKTLQGLKAIVDDDEIKAFKKLPFEKSCQDLGLIFQQFSLTWQNIPTVQVASTQAISSLNPLVEKELELVHFDTEIAEQLDSWLAATKTIHDCFGFISRGAKQLYAPWEDVFSIKNNNFSLQMYAFDSDIQQDIKLNEIKVVLSSACIRELQAVFNSQGILIQTAFLNSNPFWWYPSERPLSSNVFLLSALGGISTPGVTYLKNPFEFQLELKPHNTSHNAGLGLIKNNLHMPVYILELPANAVLIITFLRPERPLKFLIHINKPPKSLAVLRSGIKVRSTNSNEAFAFLNPLDKEARAYMAVLLDEQFENSSFSFYSEIRQCLYWDFSLKDPQWSSQGCKPKLATSTNGNLTCCCHHFSTFAARSYQAPIQELVTEHGLLAELPLNWYAVGFYSSLLILFATILLINFYHYNKHTEYLPLNSSGLANNDIELCIFTGSHWNATCSANISLSLTSPKGHFSLIIHQNPESPFLKQNSMCRLLISSQKVDIPLSLTISNDQSGRYSSWYCHKIIIRNLITLHKQVFRIDQWICQKPVEIFESGAKEFNEENNFRERFRQYLSNIYINWYQLQSLWGCWLYDDVNRFERSCIELSALAATVCLVACYFGCTTLETYEEERMLYYFLNFNILELVVLAIVCYLLHFVIRFTFSGCMWLLHKINVKIKKKF